MQPRNISLLQAKIAELRSALFFCDNQHDLAYAAHIIEVEKMDTRGAIWLYVTNHGGHGAAPGEPFPVSLNFCRKGVPYTIDIIGMASIEGVTGDKLLLKITIGRLVHKVFTETTHVPVIETIGKLFRNVFDIPEPMDEFAVSD